MIMSGRGATDAAISGSGGVGEHKQEAAESGGGGEPGHPRVNPSFLLLTGAGRTSRNGDEDLNRVS